MSGDPGGNGPGTATGGAMAGGAMAAEAGVAPILARVVPPARPLGRLALVRALARNPIESWPDRLYETGHAVVRGFGGRTVFVTDPELARQVLVAEAEGFGRSREMSRALEPALGRGLLTADGAHWRRQRRIAAPAFRHDRLDAFVPDMVASAEATAARWSRLPDGAVIGLSHEMTRTTFDIIVATMLSGGEGFDAGRVERSIADSLATTNWLMLYARLGLPAAMPYPGRRRARAARAWMRALALDIVRRRRAAMLAGGARAGDLVDLLIEAEDPEREAGGRMDDGDIADNVLTFIAAGHETTASALAWAFYALAHHPEVVARCLDEIAAAAPATGPLGREALAGLGFLRQVVQETLRLYPSAPVIARLARRGTSLVDARGGTVPIERGDTVIVPIYVMHRHRAIWTEPDRFDPDRFAPDAQAARHRYAFLPFGAGPRICIGLNFALNEAVLILATLLPRFRLEPATPHPPEPVMRITLRPRDEIRMVLRRRTG